MKIILAVHHFPPKYTGGAELQAYQTAHTLLERGHQVQVICVESIESSSSPTLAWHDEIYDRIPVRRLTFDLGRSPDPFRWSYDNPLINEHLQQLIQEDRPDLLHLVSGYLIGAGALRVAAAAGIPRVVSLMDFWFICPRITLLRTNGELSTLPIEPARCAQCLAEDKRRFRWMGRLAPRLASAYWARQRHAASKIAVRRDFLLDALRSADAVITHSRFLREMFIQIGLPPAKVLASRQGVAPRELPDRRSPKRESSALRVGYLGQIAPHKGVHVLVEALRLMPEAPIQLEIFGDQTRFPDYTRMLAAAIGGDDRIHFAGPYTPASLTSLLETLDLIVAPSLWYENSPNVILEAFAHRIPVAASRLGGMVELLGDGAHGLLFEPGDAQDLARVLREVLSTPEILAQIRRGLPPVKTIEAEMDELEKIYRLVVAGKFSVPESLDVGQSFARDVPARSG